MKKFKFGLGDVVYLTSDKNRKVPMTITRLLEFDPDDNDYVVVWVSSQGKLEGSAFPEKAITD